MKDFLTFGIKLLPSSATLSFLNSLQKLIFSIGDRLKIIDKDFNNIFDSRQQRNTARIVGELEGLYGDISEHADKTKKSLMSSVDFSNMFGKSVSLSAKVFETVFNVSRKITTEFIKLPLTLFNAVSGMEKLKGLVMDAYQEFEKLVSASQDLQKFYQGSKQFADGLTMTAQTLSKDVVGVTTESLTSFMKEATRATKGFFNPKDLTADTVKAINNLAGALGTDFSSAASKFQEFMSGNSDVILSLGDSLQHAGIELSSLTTASQNAQAGFAGANQRMQNLTELLNQKLKDSNEISKQSVSGITELIKKNIESILPSFINPIYNEIRSIFVKLYDFIKSNEALLKNVLQSLGQMVAPMVRFISDALTSAIQLTVTFFSKTERQGTITAAVFQALRTSVSLLVNTFKFLYDIVVRVFKAFSETPIGTIFKDALSLIEKIATVFSSTIMRLIDKAVQGFENLLRNAKFISQVLTVWNTLTYTFTSLFDTLMSILEQVYDAVSDVAGSFVNGFLNSGLVDTVSKTFVSFTSSVQGNALIFKDLILLLGDFFKKIFEAGDVFKSFSILFDTSRNFIDSFMDVFQSFRAIMQDYYKSLFSMLQPLVKILFKFVDLVLKTVNVLVDLTKKLYNFIEPLIYTIKDIYTSIFSMFEEIFNIGASWFDGFLKDVDDVFTIISVNFNSFLRMLEPIVNMLKRVGDGIKSIFDGIKMMFSGNIRDGLVHIGTHLWDAFVGIIEDLFEFIKDAILGFFSKDSTPRLASKFRQDFVFDEKGSLADTETLLKSANTLEEKTKIQSLRKNNIDNLLADYGSLSRQFQSDMFESLKNQLDYRTIKQQIETLKNSGYDESQIKEKLFEMYRDAHTKLSYSVNDVLDSAFKGLDYYKFTFKDGKTMTITREMLNKNERLKNRFAQLLNYSQKFGVDLSQMGDKVESFLSVAFDSVEKAVEKSGEAAKKHAEQHQSYGNAMSKLYMGQADVVKKLTNDALAEISNLSKQQQDYFQALQAFKVKAEELENLKEGKDKENLKSSLSMLSAEMRTLTDRLSEKDKAQLASVGGVAYFEMLNNVSSKLEELFKNPVLIEVKDKTQKVDMSLSGERKTLARLKK